MRVITIATLALLTGVPLWAQTTFFQTGDPWETGPANQTRSVAVGDVDLDGDLDLVCGNLNGGNTLYLGVGGAFERVPVWSSGAANTTLSVALGDIDGDGYLDLVCGNSGQGNRLYLNRGGFFADPPDWTSSEANFTQSVALGDIDGDGKLDLVCGNNNQPNTVYINIGGTFPLTPDPLSPASEATKSVTLGDVDGNGYLDVVCGNDGANTLYLNVGGVFDPVAAWMSSPVPDSLTFGVSLGDLDGDGDLDLACGNFRQRNTVYENLGATFGPDPVWFSSPTDGTRSVVLTDVDGNGDLDLLCGNRGNANNLYLNVGGPSFLDSTSAWSSKQENETISIAAADVNGDGDLDLVCGNSGQTNTLYLNVDGPFQATPDWFSSSPNPTFSVALGDVNGDGDLDLVCGNNGSNTLYLNGGSLFETTSSWPANQPSLSEVALGDMDGNTFLDVVCGNSRVPAAGAENTIYFNLSGSLSALPLWSSVGTANITLGVALGDIDGNGILDIVYGNTEARNTVYLNPGTTFATSPAWFSQRANSTTSVALGDVDRQGGLDLVCGNTSGESNTLYLNPSTMLDTASAWFSGQTNNTGDVALGDINGDSYLDLVCGNDGQANTLYLNLGGLFDTAPAWSSSGQPRNTAGVALGDVDGDGDLDLVCSNLGEPNTAYLNVGGTFAATPVWLSGPANASEDVALADVDEDGDLDVVFANQNQLNTAYKGDKNPPYRGVPAAPTNQLANNPAFLSSVTVTKVDDNTRRVNFAVTDVESDRVWVKTEFQFEGDPNWQPASTGGPLGLNGPFASSASGEADLLDWNIELIMFDSRSVNLRLTVIEIPSSVSVIQANPSFIVSVGRLVPSRPEITPVTELLDFIVLGALTVGDTLPLELGVSNTGNVDLTVDSIRVPSVEMRTLMPGPFVIAPGATVAIPFLLEPVLETNIGGSVEIYSNDPVTPVASITVVTDIRALEVTSRLLTPSQVLPLGEAATVIVEPLPDVQVEDGWLFHRATGSQTWNAINLSSSGNDFIAVIPGASVTEAGLEYYVSVVNPPVINTDPSGAPGSFYSRSVEMPMSIASSPTPTEEDQFIEGRDINVRVALPQGTIFQGGTLYFREGGTTSYGQQTLAFDGVTPSGTIPDSLVGSRGVDYWVEVQTLTDTLTDPATNPSLRPASIPIVNSDVVEPTSHAALKFRLLSIPLKMQGSILGSIADDVGGVDITQWRLFAHDAADTGYIELPNDSTNTFSRGQAYWFITRKRHRIGTGPDPGETTLTTPPFEITLQPGYNLVADPFTFPVPWDSMLVDTMSMAEAEGLFVEPPIGWVPGKGLQDSVEVFAPFDGYWVKNLSESPVSLKIPSIDADAVTPPQSQPANRENDNWGIRIAVSSRDAYDASGFVGVRPDAATAWDRNDRSKPPLAPGNAVSLYFPHSAWDKHPGRYTHDIRGESESFTREVSDAVAFGEEVVGHVWRFDVAKNFAVETVDEVELSFIGVEQLPDGLAAYLVDGDLGIAQDLRDSSTYRFYSAQKEFVSRDREARFELIVGDEAFAGEGRLPSLPSQTRLYPNYPNPFNPNTVIRYAIADHTVVTLRIYDARGGLVRELYAGTRSPGVYESAWDARNDAGQTVASGVYFYRLDAGDITNTRKMVLLK